MKLRIAWIVLASSCALAREAWSQDDTRIHKVGAGSGNFGYCVCGVGDVNRDGVADFAVGWPCAHSISAERDGHPSFSGEVQVHSGSTGALLYRVDGEVEHQLFGASIAALDDLDGDGVSDFAVGSVLGGVVRIVSGRTGKTISRLNGTTSQGGELFGWSLARIRDIDGDHVDDLLVGAPRSPARSEGAELIGERSGAAYLFSGKTAKLLRSFTVDVLAKPPRGFWFGCRVADAGDVDGDGVDDLAIASCGEALFDLDGRDRWNRPSERKTRGIPYNLAAELAPVDRDLSHAPELGRVSIFSGKTGALIRQLVGERAGDGFGCSIASLGDVNGDGRADLAVGAYSAECGGAVYTFDGASGNHIAFVHGVDPSCEFGYTVVDIGDQNGDGIDDLAVADPCVERGMNRSGEVAVLSGRDLSRLWTLNEGDLDLNVSDFGFAIAPIESRRGKSSSFAVGALNDGIYGMVFTYAPDCREHKLHLVYDGLYGDPRK